MSDVKLCKDCISFEKREDLCVRVIDVFSDDLLYGPRTESRLSTKMARLERSERGDCGPEGKLWVRQP